MAVFVSGQEKITKNGKNKTKLKKKEKFVNISLVLYKV